MRLRVVVGDVRQPLRGIVELEAGSYVITEGMLVIRVEGDLAAPAQVIATWAPGAWRSIVEVEGFRRALQPGSVSDEVVKGSRTKATSEDTPRGQAQRSP